MNHISGLSGLAQVANDLEDLLKITGLIVAVAEYIPYYNWCKFYESTFTHGEEVPQ